MSETTWRIFYDGRVQGVGFRYFVKSLAVQYPIVGYVRNRRDGRVEVIARGHFAALESFVKEIQSSSPGEISQATIERDFETWQPLDSFEIR
ncbi:MAG TPA: acylphosphatase [Pirellulaceae bacterium]|nr:acylphosphatase [Pirellulaceae bacterium]HMO92748.1 acylphosphatase [Pirellulaceae bacterium]HMP70300.1 acylphosphatase [Pirellulaceae bacterium]